MTSFEISDGEEAFSRISFAEGPETWEVSHYRLVGGKWKLTGTESLTRREADKIKNRECPDLELPFRAREDLKCSGSPQWDLEERLRLKANKDGGDIVSWLQTSYDVGLNPLPALRKLVGDVCKVAFGPPGEGPIANPYFLEVESPELWVTLNNEEVVAYLYDGRQNYFNLKNIGAD